MNGTQIKGNPLVDPFQIKNEIYKYLNYNGFDKVVNYEKNWIFYPMSKWGY